MKTYFVLLVCCGGLMPIVRAQPGSVSAQASDSIGAARQSEAVKLDPFEIKADSDNSYGALNSNSITQFNAELDQLPVSADIFNETFMKDVAATSVEQLIQTYSAGSGLNQSAQSAVSTQPGDRVQNDSLSLRGLGAQVVRRDGFLPLTNYANTGTTGVGFTSVFDLERVEVINGPQALLFGNSGAGGAINYVSKQARFDKSAFGSDTVMIDQYGTKLDQLDYGTGGKNFAIRLALLDESLDSRRVNIGGKVDGAYLQVAFKPFANTTVRVYGEQTHFDRDNPQALTYTGVSTANDARNGQTVHYLLATGQLGQAAGGAPSGGGNIGQGVFTWDNVDSFAGLLGSEHTLDSMDFLTADTTWTPWLSSEVDVAYKYYNTNDANQTSFNFYPPGQANDPFSVPALAVNGTPFQDRSTTSRTKAARVSFLATNDLFGGRAHSQTIFGADAARIDSSFITYSYYQADSNWNVIINPATTALIGRTLIPAYFFPLGPAPLAYPEPAGYKIGVTRFTDNGVNYVRMLQNPVNRSLISPNNPEGVTTLGGGNYYQVKNLNSGYYAVNDTQWFDNRVDTLVGARMLNYFEATQSQGVLPTAKNPSSFATKQVAGKQLLSFDAGVNYALCSWLRPYVTVSNAYNPPITQQNDPYGSTPGASKGLGEEVGLKFTNASRTLSGSLAAYHVNDQNEVYATTATLEGDINPSGLNGPYQAPSVFVTVNREVEGIQYSMTAAPTKGWRMRLSASDMIKAQLESNSNYALLYNDQFNEDKSGDVTYADGSIVYVPPAFNSKQLTVTSTTAGAIPLTVAMLSNATSPYYTNPLPVSGQITSTSPGGQVLKVVDPTHGSILTGATGLPISALQINPGFTPPASLVLAQSGDQSVGTPKYALSFTNNYTFSEGWAKGLTLGGTVGISKMIGKFYYYTNGVGNGIGVPRSLFYMPDLARFDLMFGYARQFGRLRWSTQLNITNVFNFYHLVIIPSAVTAYSSTGLNAVFDQQPRMYQWTNTISF